MYRKLLLVVSAVAVTVMLGLSSAYADTITLGDSCTGGLTATGSTLPTVTGSATGCFAYFETKLPPVTLSYSITTGTTLSISGSGNSMGGSIVWLTATPTGTDLTITGTLTVEGAVTGFNGDFLLGGTYPIDLTIKKGGVISSGEVSTVPEPGTLGLLGTGLVGIAGVVRRKLFGA